MTSRKTTRIGVDVGGTFTDFVLHDDSRGIIRTGKQLTTPDAPSRAIVEGISRLLSETDTHADQIQAIVHGTTLITNTVLERTGARVGLLTTAGFRDVLAMGREFRYDVDDLFLDSVPVIVPRRLRLEVGGRLGADGAEFDPLDEEAVTRSVRHLVEEERIEALAISFLHSYRNPEHELRALDLVRSLYPNLLVSLSSRVAPEIREFERTCTTCVNAYVQPQVHGYMARLSDDLRALGFCGDLHIMLSGGGVTTVDDAKEFPVRLIESGPAAGALAAAHTARRMNESRVISFDMGGTTAKMCLVESGAPRLKHDFEAGRLRRYMQGSGLPLKVTVIDMIEIGSGGGSIAAADGLGLMKVGPRSASSVPGPVCFRRGGTEPTVTDADLLLGCLDADNFLGGEMKLSVGRVREAIHERLSEPMGITMDAAARGIQEIVNENMAAATRMHLAENGKDPRDYSLFAFGGAGPVHAYALAKLLKVRRLVVPMGAGVYSAFGFLVASPVVDQVRGLVCGLEAADWQRVNALYADMRVRCESLLPRVSDVQRDVVWTQSADMRYAGQGFEIETPLPKGPLGSANVDAIRQSFVSTYADRFGREVRDVGVEIVSWRLRAQLPQNDFSLARHTTEREAIRGRRDVYFPGFGNCETVVVDRYALPPGTVMQGPVVVEERESSCSIGPDARLTVDEHLNLVIEIGAAQ